MLIYSWPVPLLLTPEYHVMGYPPIVSILTSPISIVLICKSLTQLPRATAKTKNIREARVSDE
jgi:hypothetical protein